MRRNNNTHSLSRLLLLVVLLLLVAPTNPAEDRWFELADSNQDGAISREEYTLLRKKLDTVLAEPLNESAASTNASPLEALQRWFTSLSVPSGESSNSVVSAFTSSLSMIIATEIGDKTFFIAAVLSMKSDRFAVFSGAIFALIVMTILSTVMGMVLPSFLPRKYTHIIGGLLFLYFGVKLIIDSRSMESNKVSDELEEVEEELGASKKAETSTPDEESADSSLNKKKMAPPSSKLSWTRVLMQSLALTFVAEWGDRSQIATIALAAAKDPWGVTVGAVVGHSLCTGMAVLGGRMLASRISEKTVSLWGGVIFLIFGLHGLFWET